jgi:hypothetical protein
MIDLSGLPLSRAQFARVGPWWVVRGEGEGFYIHL